MKRILFIVAVTLIAICGFTFLSHQGEADADGQHHHEHEEETDFDNIPLTQQQINTVDLKMGELTERELDATIQVNGQLVLRAQHMGDVASLMGGIVKSILVKEGDHVSKGQVVATVENTDVVALQREYFSACKDAEMARLEMQRQQTLQQNGAGVKKTMQQATKDLKVAEASVTGIGRQLQQMGISTAAVAKGNFATVFPLRAPIGGTVSQLTASLGSYADMQTPLMKIRDNAAVEADLNIFERDLAKVKKGDKVMISLTNQPGVTVAGHVYGINQYFNDGTKAVAAHVRLDAAKHAHLFDGMYVQGAIATGRQVCPTLPTKAIVTADGKNYVFLLNGAPKGGNYSFSRHEVKTGVVQGEYTEVSPCKHMKKGTKIVIDNAFYLASLTGKHGEHNH